MSPIEKFIEEHRTAAALFLELVRSGPVPITIVYHNDADGIAAAAVLSHALGRLGLQPGLLPVEKIHEIIIGRIHKDARDLIFYADLGGQSSGLIGRYARKSSQVIILDHHLPGGAVPGNVSNLNAELHGISGDNDASGAAVCALFARELLRKASLSSAREEAWLAALGVVGAIGDGQHHEGVLTGINAMLLEAALSGEAIETSARGYIVPRLGNRTLQEVVEILNLLGSVGFYSGSAGIAVRFLLGTDTGEALEESGRLRGLKTACFEIEAETVRLQGLAESDHFQWVDVKDRFVPMGVKAIGLFLEHLIEEDLICRDKYLIGFQHLPVEMPGIGTLGRSLTKISARVHPELRNTIQQGNLPDFMTLIPQASLLVQGTADGCHRFTAASLIEQGREADFIQALEEVLARTRRDNAG